jgi:hypothetical protein
MASKDIEKSSNVKLSAGSDPAAECGPDSHWDDAQGRCVPNASENPVGEMETVVMVSSELSAKN